ncbi:myb-like DNA-binding domain-containing protein [Blastocystis sp. subtype 4]|uniref:myb-like DNA-binding domain-containing protein n=1 Tax=Blastocystis sp. subtype 4 TaxID=944170 RepID=UPI000711CE35|nr:myb-like DNA-binding domain-containing protein [Blastocystis sp. subtype 4]KNB45669.1 myb-like DNA-binding domain-containing protein [Blastocystis sp. subtype 4]|eukprot:XP_014529111.1 myb-like DNA-binding domain-containing protein [Blastocystis sp. subtype 4]
MEEDTNKSANTNTQLTLVDPVIDAVAYLQEIAKNPSKKNLQTNPELFDILALIRNRMYRKPNRSLSKHKIAEKKEKIQGSIHTDKVKGNGNPQPVVSVAVMDVAGDWTPWESQSPIKAASKLGRGRRIGQSQYQMETYLSCVNSIYGQRSVIPYGLHSTQLYLFRRARLLGQLASDLVPQTPLEKWSPHEVAVFEAAMCVYGKEFHQISAILGTKTTAEPLLLMESTL